MEKENIFTIILMLILICAIPILLLNFIKAKNEFSETHSYTTAICNETNYCQDNLVKCNEDQVISISPITGAAVQFSENWQDLRDEETRNSFCE